MDPRDEDSVMRYLRENPDFFGRHPTLLTDLSLPHDSGEAISLVERQVAILRERNIDMRRRLTHLVGAANNNDTLFEKTRRFTLQALDCETLDAIDGVLADTLIDDFAADYARCFVSHPRAFASRTSPDLRRLGRRTAAAPPHPDDVTVVWHAARRRVAATVWRARQRRWVGGAGSV